MALKYCTSSLVQIFHRSLNNMQVLNKMGEFHGGHACKQPATGYSMCKCRIRWTVSKGMGEATYIAHERTQIDLIDSAPRSAIIVTN